MRGRTFQEDASPDAITQLQDNVNESEPSLTCIRPGAAFISKKPFGQFLIDQSLARVAKSLLRKIPFIYVFVTIKPLISISFKYLQLFNCVFFCKVILKNFTTDSST